MAVQIELCWWNFAHENKRKTDPDTKINSLKSSSSSDTQNKMHKQKAAVCGYARARAHPKACWSCSENIVKWLAITVCATPKWSGPYTERPHLCNETNERERKRKKTHGAHTKHWLCSHTKFGNAWVFEWTGKNCARDNINVLIFAKAHFMKTVCIDFAYKVHGLKSVCDLASVAVFFLLSNEFRLGAVICRWNCKLLCRINSNNQNGFLLAGYGYGAIPHPPAKSKLQFLLLLCPWHSFQFTFGRLITNCVLFKSVKFFHRRNEPRTPARSFFKCTIQIHSFVHLLVWRWC